MAAIYGSGEHIWNKSVEEEIEVLQRLLENDFPTITLITGVAIAVLGPVTMTANAIVLAAIWKDPYKQLRSSPSNIIIASMACCDFLVGTLCSFMQSFWLLNMSVKSDISLYVAPFAFGIGIYLIGVSVMHVLALTIDRVVSVANPLLYKARVTRRRVVISVVMIWVSYIVMGAMGGPLNNHYYIHGMIGFIVLSTAVMTTSCLALYIIFRVRRQTQQLKKNAGVCISARGSISRDRKLTKSVLLISGVFECCFGPLLISLIFLMTCAACHTHLNIIITFYNLSLILTHVNSCLNPFLYAFRLPKFRKPVALITKRLFCCQPVKVDSRDCTESSSSSTQQVKHKNRITMGIDNPITSELDTKL